MFESTKKETLFGTPFVRIKVADAADLNRGLLDEGARLRALDGGVQKSNKGGWHSQGNLFDNPNPSVQTLRDAALQAIYSATHSIGSKADLDTLKLKLTGWMNANPRGGLNAPHTHPGAQWSGVYYVSLPKADTGNSGLIEFLDPRSDLPNWRILRAKPFRPKRKIRPTAGELILFPSYLVHWVYPNEIDEDRITIAFNGTFSKARKASGA